MILRKTFSLFSPTRYRIKQVWKHLIYTYLGASWFLLKFWRITLVDIAIELGSYVLSACEIYYWVPLDLEGYWWEILGYANGFAFVRDMCFSLSVFNVLALFCILGALTTTWQVEVFFWMYLFEDQNASYTWMLIYLLRFGKIPAISLKIISMPLMCTTVCSTIPKIHKLFFDRMPEFFHELQIPLIFSYIFL